MCAIVEVVVGDAAGAHYLARAVVAWGNAVHAVIVAVLVLPQRTGQDAARRVQDVSADAGGAGGEGFGASQARRSALLTDQTSREVAHWTRSLAAVIGVEAVPAAARQTVSGIRTVVALVQTHQTASTITIISVRTH